MGRIFARIILVGVVFFMLYQQNYKDAVPIENPTTFHLFVVAALMAILGILIIGYEKD